MKRSSNGSSTQDASKGRGGQRPPTLGVRTTPARVAARLFLLMAVCASLSALTGCEALQRKFTRKRKHPLARPTPIVHFEDYTKAMTPLERYRKHYLIFAYWNTQLIEAFRVPPISAKRVTMTSAEALSELKTMRRLLDDEAAERFAPIVAERTRLDRRLQSGRYLPGERSGIQRTLEIQTRRINREFFWRKVQDQLKEASPGDAQGP